MHTLILLLSILGLAILACSSLLKLSQDWVEESAHEVPAAPPADGCLQGEILDESSSCMSGGAS